MAAGVSGSSSQTRGASNAITAAMASTTGRQPPAWARAAMPGRKTSEPLAAEALSRPIIRPRRATNQRLTTIAPSTMATAPEPTPAITPQVATYCQGSVISEESPVETAISTRAAVTVRRRPNDCIRAAANGPVRP